MRWKVSDGKSINMWKDAWVCGNGTGKLITLVRVLDENTTVDALLDNETHTWRRDIISEASDERVWTGSLDGSFRVRDAYSLALRHQLEGSSSNGSDPI